MSQPDLTDDFLPEFARSIAVALTSYGPAVRLALTIAEGNDDAERLEAIHLVAATVGLELIGFLRVVDLAQGSFSDENPAPVLDLARALGESLAILALIRDAESAARAPVAPFERIERAYDAAARAWLARYLPELPERIQESDA